MAEQFYEQQLKRWVGEQTETSGRTTQPNGAHKVDVHEVLGFLKRTVHHHTFCIRNFNDQGRGAGNVCVVLVGLHVHSHQILCITNVMLMLHGWFHKLMSKALASFNSPGAADLYRFTWTDNLERQRGKK